MANEELIVTTSTTLLVSPEEKAFILKALADLRLKATQLPDQPQALPERTKKQEWWEVVSRASAQLSAYGQGIYLR